MTHSMLNNYDPPKEPLRVKAGRKWKNNELRKRIVEERQQPKLADPNKEPEIAETITNDGRRDGPINRMETKFKKEIRAILEGHTGNNEKYYAAWLYRRKCILLKEKLKRLQVAQQEQGG